MKTESRKLAVIMFTDIVSFSNMMSIDESMAISALDSKVSILNSHLKDYNGNLIKLIGDGTLSSFESAVKAVECAIKIVKHIDKKCEYKIRIGIHLGEIIYKNNDVFGDGVNIASRLENLAEPGTILISKDVNDQLINHKIIKTESLGKHSIKGIGRIIEIFNIMNLPKSTTGFLVNKIEDYSAHEIPSVAVLPFDNRGPKEDDFYSYGITSDLISDLSSVDKIRVASLYQTQHFDLSDIDFGKLSKKTDSRHIVTGSLWKRDKVFQLSVELYDASKKRVLWSDHWYENWNNLGNIKSKLIEGILSTLNIDENKDLGVSAKTSYITEAYEKYLKGKYIYRNRKKPEDILSSQHLIKEALKLDPKLFKANIILAETYYYDGDYNQAIDIYENCYKKALNVGSKKEAGRCLNGIGNILYDKGDFKEALEFQNQALKIRQEIDDMKGLGYSLNSIGNLYQAMGNFDKSLDYLMKSYEIRKVLSNTRLIAISLGNIGHVYWATGDYKKALEYNEKSLDLREKENDLFGVAVVYNNIGNIHYKKEDYKNALQCYNKSLKYKQKLNDSLGIGTAMNNIGCVFFQDKNYNKAINHFEKALSIRKKINNKVGISESLHHLVESYMTIKNFKQARHYLNQSIANYKKLGDDQKVAQLNKQLSLLKK